MPGSPIDRNPGQPGEAVIPTCKDMSELVTDYLDGALPRRVRWQARLHLFLCQACRRYFGQMRRTVRLLAGGPRRPPAAEVEQRVLALMAGDGTAPPGGGER